MIITKNGRKYSTDSKVISDDLPLESVEEFCNKLKANNSLRLEDIYWWSGNSWCLYDPVSFFAELSEKMIRLPYVTVCFMEWGQVYALYGLHNFYHLMKWESGEDYIKVVTGQGN